MELFDNPRGGRLDVISEDGEEHEEAYGVMSSSAARKQNQPNLSRYQHFSIDTNESLHFDPCEEEGSPSPTGAEDGHNSVFDNQEPEVHQVITHSKMPVSGPIQAKSTTLCHLNSA